LEASKSGNNENEKDVINDSVLNQEVLDNRKESVFKVMKLLSYWTSSHVCFA
jgi:hypothetical protein